MARRKKIGILDVSDEISSLFVTYGQQVNDVIDEAMEQVADESCQELRSVSRFSPNGNPTGEYSKDWVVDVEPVKRYSRKFVIHNEDHYQLAHLLESGHAKVLWGKETGQKTPAYEHIKPVNDQAQARIVQEVIERITDLNS